MLNDIWMKGAAAFIALIAIAKVIKDLADLYLKLKHPDIQHLIHSTIDDVDHQLSVARKASTKLGQLSGTFWNLFVSILFLLATTTIGLFMLLSHNDRISNEEYAATQMKLDQLESRLEENNNYNADLQRDIEQARESLSQVTESYALTLKALDRLPLGNQDSNSGFKFHEPVFPGIERHFPPVGSEMTPQDSTPPKSDTFESSARSIIDRLELSLLIESEDPAKDETERILSLQKDVLVAIAKPGNPDGSTMRVISEIDSAIAQMPSTYLRQDWIDTLVTIQKSVKRLAKIDK